MSEKQSFDFSAVTADVSQQPVSFAYEHIDATFKKMRDTVAEFIPYHTRGLLDADEVTQHKQHLATYVARVGGFHSIASTSILESFEYDRDLQSGIALKEAIDLSTNELTGLRNWCLGRFSTILASYGAQATPYNADASRAATEILATQYYAKPGQLEKDLARDRVDMITRGVLYKHIDQL
ncbi:hypothetical protein FJZ39_01360 [Candidatus Saccharibacteria bacterium]|nr:hypothetical protein [Candidatus Saccharibacteria bacterium]